MTRRLAKSATHVPGLKHVPVLKLLTVAEIGLLARTHVLRLTPDERRRLIHLVRTTRGRPSNLTERERVELGDLVGKLEPRLLAGEAVGRLSPVWLPQRMLKGPRNKRR